MDNFKQSTFITLNIPMIMTLLHNSRVLRVLGGCAKSAILITQPLTVLFSKICSNGPECQSGSELGRMDQD